MPPALYKTGEYVLSKRKGDILKVLKCWPEVEAVGLMAGVPKGYFYLVEDESGQSFKMREQFLCSPEEERETISNCDTQSNQDDRDLFDDNEDLILSQELAQTEASLASQIKSEASPTSKVKDDVDLFDSDDQESSGEEWSISQELANWQTYDKRKNSKPLPQKGKRKCFQLVSPEKAAKMPRKKIFDSSFSLKNKSTSIQSASKTFRGGPVIKSLFDSPPSQISFLSAQQYNKSFKSTITKVGLPGISKTTSNISHLAALDERSKNSSNISTLDAIDENLNSPLAVINENSETTSKISHSAVLPENSRTTSNIPNLGALPENSKITSNISCSATLPETSKITSNIFCSAPLSETSKITSNIPQSASNSEESFSTFTEEVTSAGNMDNEETLMPPPKKVFPTKEERAKITKTNYTEPRDSRRKIDAIVRDFMKYIRDRGEKRELKQIPPSPMDNMLACFWAERVKPDGGIPDCPTIHSQASRLAAYICRETNINPTTHPEFVEYRKTKTDRLKQSKQVLGNGQKAHQSDALDPEEISHFFETGLINYASGPGITRMFYVTFMLTLNCRAVKDHMTFKWGNLRILRNEESGLIECAYFVSQFSKTDDGSSLKGVSRRGIIPPSSNRRTCFFTYLQEYVRQRAMLGPEFLEPESPLYLQPRLDGTDYVKTKNVCMFQPVPIKKCFLDNLVQNMCIGADIEPEGRIITDTSLRVSSFHAQEDLGIDSETGKSVSGHVSKETAATYRRKHELRLNKMGAGLMSTMTGVPAVIPPTHGEKFKRKKSKPITVLDTSSTLMDFSTQLLLMKRLQQSDRFKPGDKFDGTKSFEAHIIRLVDSKLEEESEDLPGSPEINESSDLSSILEESLPVNNAQFIQNLENEVGSATFAIERDGTLSEVSISSHDTENVPGGVDIKVSHKGDNTRVEANSVLTTITQVNPSTISSAFNSARTSSQVANSTPLNHACSSTPINRAVNSISLNQARNFGSNVTKYSSTSTLANSMVSARVSLVTSTATSMQEETRRVFANQPVKSKEELSPGDLVFYKIKGHKDPHWPSRITTMSSASYTVQFLGTSQIAVVPRSSLVTGHLVPLSSSALDQFSTPSNLAPHKKKNFVKGLAQMTGKSDPLQSLQQAQVASLKKSVSKLSSVKKSVSKLSRKTKKPGKENRPKPSSFDDDIDDFVF